MLHRGGHIATLFLICVVAVCGWGQAPLPPPAGLSAEELQNQGDVLREQRAFAGALEYYRAAALKKPTDARLWNQVGMMNLQLSKFDDARREFSRATKLDRNYAEAYNNLGVVCYLRRDYRKAIRYYEKAIGLYQNAASFHSNLAAVYFARKQADRAMQEYARAFALDPDIFERMSRGGEAAQMRTPEDRALYSYVVAKLYAKTGDTERSLLYLRRAMEEGYKDIKKVYTDEEFASLRTDPRFVDLMKNRPQPLPK